MSINRQIILTLLVLIFTIMLFGITDIDTVVQDELFDSSTSTWVLDRDLQPYRLIFYDGIKKVLILFALSFLIGLLFFRKHKLVQEYKRGMLILVLSAIFIPLTIGGLKKYTNMPCPKNEIHYGGKMIKTSVWQSYDEPYKSMKKIRCWPAGHASGGFALLSLFFLFKTKRNKVLALVIALSVGWTMGIYKMLIGDHFLSHTIISMIIAWLIVLILLKIVDKIITPISIHLSKRKAQQSKVNL